MIRPSTFAKLLAFCNTPRNEQGEPDTNGQTIWDECLGVPNAVDAENGRKLTDEIGMKVSDSKKGLKYISQRYPSASNPEFPTFMKAVKIRVHGEDIGTEFVTFNPYAWGVSSKRAAGEIELTPGQAKGVDALYQQLTLKAQTEKLSESEQATAELLATVLGKTVGTASGK